MEKEQNHRHDMEEKIVTSREKLSNRGQIFAFILSIIVFAISGFLIYSGFEWAGTIICGASFVALIGLFISGHYRQAKSIQQKKGNTEQ